MANKPCITNINHNYSPLFTKVGSRKMVKGGNININDLQTKNINTYSMIPGIQNIFLF